MQYNFNYNYKWPIYPKEKGIINYCMFIYEWTITLFYMLSTIYVAIHYLVKRSSRYICVIGVNSKKIEEIQ